MDNTIAPRSKTGRPTIGEAPMSAAERKRRQRQLEKERSTVEVGVLLNGSQIAFLETQAAALGAESYKAILQDILEKTLAQMRMSRKPARAVS